MNRSLEQLITSMEKATEIYQELNQLALTKRDAIKRERIEELDKITNHEMGLVTALYKLEEIRAKIVAHVISDYGMFNVQTLTDIANQLPPVDRQAVLHAKDNLLLGIKTVSEETKFNNKLIEDRLSMIEMTIHAITQTGDSVTYGGKEIPERKNIFDVKG